jgi:flagellar motor protein MotB
MRNKIIIIIYFFVLLLLVSCSARYIRVNSLNHAQEAIKGDTVTFSWDISNADYVKIEGMDKKFKATDYFKIFADSTTNFILTAYHGKKDSIKRNINLIVKPSEAISGIDDTKKDEFILMPTVDSSNNFPGIKDYTDGSTFSEIKIKNIFKESDKSEEYKIRFILLDDFGNFLNNVDLNKSGLQLSLSQTYGPDKYTHIYNKIKSSLNIPSDICILIDNSLSPSNQQELLTEINNYLVRLPDESNVMISVFNNKYDNIIKPVEKNSAKSMLKNIQLSPNGLAAVYDATYQALMDLSSSSKEEKMLIVILNNSDNASLTRNYNDCIELSGKLNIPVYFIVLNDYISSYPLKLISLKSGGYVYYKSDYGNNFNLNSLLSEIELSSRIHYEISAPLFNSPEKTKIININLSLIQNDKKISDKSIFYSSEIITPNERKIIATFDEKEHKLKEEYAEQIFSLAQLLIDNPERKIRLVGHSSKSEDSSFVESVSLKRAFEIKEKLLILGVNDSQIEITAAGSSKPLYSFEQEEWQKEMNRRVEFKWIDPSTLPYEIIAQKTNSEYSAIKFTEEWEKQGFRSYFERVESLNEPLYIVKIWGFATKEEAEKTINKLKQKFTLVLDIE